MIFFSEDDVSPNDNLTFTAFKQHQQAMQPKIEDKSDQSQSNGTDHHGNNKSSVKSMTSSDILMLALQELHNER